MIRSLAILSFVVLASLGPVEPVYAAANPPALPAKSVSNLPPDKPGGRVIRVRAGADLQAAINSARPGDTLVLDAGATWTGNFELPARKESGWTTIRSSAESKLSPPGRRVSPGDSPAMPKLLTPNASPAVVANDGSHGWRLVGLEVAVVPSFKTVVYSLVSFGWGTGPWGHRVPSDDIASRFIVERCYIHGSQTQRVQRGISANAADVRIADSWIDEIHNSGADSQAILIYDSPGPFLIENNELQASSENIMLGGADSSRPDLVPSDVVIRRNHIIKPLRWRSDDPSYDGIPWVIKPLIELKSAQRVLIEGNTLENSWSWPAFVADSFNQDGSAPWSVVQDVLFRYNLILRAVCPWQAWAGNVPIRRLAILHNAVDEAFDPGYGNAYTRGAVGNFIASRTLPIEDLWLEHNTVLKARRGITISAAGLLPRLTIRNNAFPYGPMIEGSWVWKDTGNPNAYSSVLQIAPERDMRSNALFGPPQQLRLVYDEVEFRLWVSAKAAGVNPNGTLQDSSPLKRAATDGTDIGADLVALSAALAAPR